MSSSLLQIECSWYKSESPRHLPGIQLYVYYPPASTSWVFITGFSLQTKRPRGHLHLLLLQSLFCSNNKPAAPAYSLWNLSANPGWPHVMCNVVLPRLWIYVAHTLLSASSVQCWVLCIWFFSNTYGRLDRGWLEQQGCFLLDPTSTTEQQGVVNGPPLWQPAYLHPTPKTGNQLCLSLILFPHPSLKKKRLLSPFAFSPTLFVSLSLSIYFYLSGLV